MPRSLARDALLRGGTVVLQLAASVVLTPLVARALGVAGYGVIVLLSSLASWALLLSAGLGPTLVRALAEHRATGNAAERDETASTVFAAFLVAGASCLLLALALAPGLERIFHIPPAHVRGAQVTLLLLAVAMAVQFPGSVNGALLMAHERYDLTLRINLGLLALRTAATVVVVRRWPSIELVAAVSAGAMVLEQVAYFVLARRIDPTIRVSLRLARRSRLRSLSAFSGRVLLVGLSERLIHASDELVIATALGPAPVSDYAFALRLVDYPREALLRGAEVALPNATGSHAKGRDDALRALWLSGSKGLLCFAVPAAWTLALWGDAALSRWLTPDVGARGRWIVVLLAPALVASVAGRMTARPILIALGDLTPAVRASAFEGIANLLLSVVLVRRMGIEGVALGTLIPSLVAGLFAMPLAVGRRLGVSWARWAREVLLPVVAASPPTVIALVGMRAAGLDRSLPGVALAGAVALVVYVITAWWAVLTPQERAWVMKRQA